MTKNEFLVLLERFHQRQLSAAEIDALLDAAKEFEFENLLTDKLQQELLEFNPDADAGTEKEQKVWSGIREYIHENEEATILQPDKVRRIYPVRKWVWAAASVIALLGVGTYFLYSKKDPETAKVISKPKSEVPAGKNGAILTLADGKEILLDSLPDGLIAMQGGTAARVENGRLLYEGTGNDTIVYNTMSTPRGRQFKLTLPDGSQVWLNAASSIKYPTSFKGKTRTVKISGEAYFEVVNNIHQPFIVNAANEAVVEVLGTAFNVNAYIDENNIKATLINGSVKVKSTVNGLPANVKTEALLKPGQQAIVALPASIEKESSAVITINNEVNTDKVLAWKKGIFNFEGSSLVDIMNELERWYDIEVVYEGVVPDMKFYGKIGKNLPLSDLLEMLDKLKVKFMIEGRKLIVKR